MIIQCNLWENILKPKSEGNLTKVQMKLSQNTNGTIAAKNYRNSLQNNTGAVFSPLKNKNQSKNEVSFKGASNFKKLFTSEPIKFVIGTDEFQKINSAIDGKLSKYTDEALEFVKSGKFDKKFELKGGSEFIFEDKSLPKKFAGKVSHLFSTAWVDVANSTIEKLQKTKLMQNSEVLNNIKNAPLLTNRRKVVAANEVFGAIHGILEKSTSLDKNGARILDSSKVGKLKDTYSEAFGSKSGNYSIETERAFNKIACGLVSGSFAARDFYNISRYHTDDDKSSKKAQHKRLRQELFRSGINALLLYTGMGALSKYTNNSRPIAIATLVGTTLVAELGSRAINKTPLLPLTPEQAKKIHQKKYSKTKQDEKTPLKENFVEYASLNNIVKTPNAVESFKTKTASGEIKLQDEASALSFKSNKNEKKKDNKAFKNVLKIFGALFTAGASAAFLKYNFRGFDSFLTTAKKSCGDAYNKMVTREVEVPKEKMDKLLKKLTEIGNEDMAKEYKGTLSKGPSDLSYKIATKKSKIKPFVDVLLFPINFVMKAPKFGMRTVDRFIKPDAKINPKKTTEVAENVLAMYKKLRNKTDSKTFENDVEKIVKRTLSINTSGQDNRALLKDFLFFNTLIPSYFFVNDFRNHELIESNGQDEERISTTTKTKVGQRVINYFSNSFFVNLFSGLFGNAFNSSIPAATLITAATELSNETTIRKLIGVPTKKMSKQQIINFEENNYYSQGLKGKYMRFISDLTGKKPLGKKAEDQKKKEEKKL